MNLNFRSSLHGFNRQDVANYLEYLNNRHAAQVNQLNTDLEALRRQAEAPAEDPQRAALETRCQELEQQLAAARKERDEALAQKEAVEQKLEAAQRDREEAIRRLLYGYFKMPPIIKAQNTTETTVEFLYEVSRKMLDQARKAQRPEADGSKPSLNDRLYALGGIHYVNLVVQSDEIA